MLPTYPSEERDGAGFLKKKPVGWSVPKDSYVDELNTLLRMFDADMVVDIHVMNYNLVWRVRHALNLHPIRPRNAFRTNDLANLRPPIQGGPFIFHKLEAMDYFIREVVLPWLHRIDEAKSNLPQDAE